MTIERPCLGCGGTITADPALPAAVVREHQRSPRHRYWADGGRVRCATCPVTIPATRRLCHFCRRTAEMAA